MLTVEPAQRSVGQDTFTRVKSTVDHHKDEEGRRYPVFWYLVRIFILLWSNILLLYLAMLPFHTKHAVIFLINM